MAGTKDWFIEKLIARTVKSLASNYFDAQSFSERKSLIEAVLKHVTPGIKIGIGGSLTVRGIGLMEELAKKDVELLDHWREGLTKEEIGAIRLRQLTCDLFFRVQMPSQKRATSSISMASAIE